MFFIISFTFPWPNFNLQSFGYSLNYCLISLSSPLVVVGIRSPSCSQSTCLSWSLEIFLDLNYFQPGLVYLIYYYRPRFIIISELSYFHYCLCPPFHRFKAPHLVLSGCSWTVNGSVVDQRYRRLLNHLFQDRLPQSPGHGGQEGHLGCWFVQELE